jgi:hypothetical protein
MKILLWLLILSPSVSLWAADDLSDAKTAFATLVQYQKDDDIRALDLFTQHCLIVYKVIDDKPETNTVIIPAETFRASLKKEIEQKPGNKDEYRNVQYVSDGFSVTVTANMYNPDTGKETPFLAKYGRGSDGMMKIEEMRVTIFKSNKGLPAR